MATRAVTRYHSRMTTPPTESMPDATRLTEQRCQPCTGDTPPLDAARTQLALQRLPRWSLSSDGAAIERTVTFRRFPRLIAFLVELGMLAETEGHHPDFSCSYTALSFRLSTHAIGGLSWNDIILAAKIDELLRERRTQAHDA